MKDRNIGRTGNISKIIDKIRIRYILYSLYNMVLDRYELC